MTRIPLAGAAAAGLLAAAAPLPACAYDLPPPADASLDDARAGWQPMQRFRESVAVMVYNGYVPTRFAVRVHAGEAQFSARWSNRKMYSYSFTVHDSRASAEAVIEEHRDPGPGMIDKLCLTRHAHARDGAREYWMVLLVDPDQSGLRCRDLPAR